MAAMMKGHEPYVFTLARARYVVMEHELSSRVPALEADRFVRGGDAIEQTQCIQWNENGCRSLERVRKKRRTAGDEAGKMRLMAKDRRI